MTPRVRQNARDMARRRFLVIQGGIVLALSVAVIATKFAILRVDERALQWLLSTAPVALLALWAWEFFRLVRNDDEMMQALQFRAISVSAMVVLLGGTMWGVLERLMDVPQFPMFLLLPAFALTYGLVWSWMSKQA